MSERNQTSGQREGGQGTNRVLHVLFVLTLGVAYGLPARAQVLLSASDAERARHDFADAARGGRLRCTIDRRMPMMDFAFRFDAGFIVHFPLRQFRGRKSAPVILLRVTPKGGAPVFLGEGCRLPAVLPGVDPGGTQIECSGGFSIGEGTYQVAVLTIDEFGRSYQKQWRISAIRNHDQQRAPEVIPANTVRPIPLQPWDGKLQSDGKGIRLTVLLDVAPINPYVFKMRAWDRSFLLTSLASLLEQTPCATVRMIAFSLQQQREIFREEHFDASGFLQLSRAIGDLELGIVSARTLQNRLGWVDVLARLSNQESTAPDPSDAVVFLGPATMLDHKVPQESLKPQETSSPRFFYFEYYPQWRGGSEFPDSIEYLTKARQGTVFRIHSPGEWAQAIQKMLRQQKAGGEKPGL